ncbi:MAG: glycosyl transferase family 2, partial [Parachlamydiaceae bacterium]
MMIDPEGDSLKVFPYYADNEEIVSAILRGVGGAIIHPSAMIRKEAIQEVGGYDSEFKHAEDMELFLRLSEIGHLANLPEILFLYRQNPNGIGYKNRKLQQEAYLKSLKNA